MSANTEQFLFSSLGLKGGQYCTGVGARTGEFFCLMPTAATTVTTVGNISGLTGVSLAAGSTLFGHFSVVTYSGALVIYDY